MKNNEFAQELKSSGGVESFKSTMKSGSYNERRDAIDDLINRMGRQMLERSNVHAMKWGLEMFTDVYKDWIVKPVAALAVLGVFIALARSGYDHTTFLESSKIVFEHAKEMFTEDMGKIGLAVAMTGTLGVLSKGVVASFSKKQSFPREFFEREMESMLSSLRKVGITSDEIFRTEDERARHPRQEYTDARIPSRIESMKRIMDSAKLKCTKDSAFNKEVIQSMVPEMDTDEFQRDSPQPTLASP